MGAIQAIGIAEDAIKNPQVHHALAKKLFKRVKSIGRSNGKRAIGTTLKSPVTLKTQKVRRAKTDPWMMGRLAQKSTSTSSANRQASSRQRPFKRTLKLSQVNLTPLRTGVTRNDFKA